MADTVQLFDCSVEVLYKLAATVRLLDVSVEVLYLDHVPLEEGGDAHHGMGSPF